MNTKRIVQFKLDENDDNVMFMEIDDQEEVYGMQRVARNDDGIEEAESRFAAAIERVKPAAKKVLEAFQEMNTPDEIGLEFGVKFNAKAGAILASVDSEATFKVSLKWANPK